MLLVAYGPFRGILTAGGVPERQPSGRQGPSGRVAERELRCADGNAFMMIGAGGFVRVQTEEQVGIQDQNRRRSCPAVLIAGIVMVTLLGGYSATPLAHAAEGSQGVEAAGATPIANSPMVTLIPFEQATQAAEPTDLHWSDGDGEGVGGESRDTYDWLMAAGPLIGVAVAVLIAAFGPSMRRIVRHPVLRVSINESDRDDCHKTEWVFGEFGVPGVEAQLEDSDVPLQVVVSPTAHTSSHTPPRIIYTRPDTATRSAPGGETEEGEEKSGQRNQLNRIGVYYLRLKVHNDGNERAEDVDTYQVYASELRRQIMSHDVV